MALLDKYTVYKHTNKENGKVYIGITSQTTERRWQNGAGYYRTYFGNAIAKYGWDGFTHEILFTGLTKEDACRIEIELIAKYKSNNREYGYNVAEGGQTADVVRVKSGAENPRASAVRRINPLTGDQKEYETIREAANEMGINYRGISKACHGISQTYMGYVWEYTNKNIEKKPAVGVGKYDHYKICKKIKMIDVNGKETVYESIKEAGRVFGVRPNTISRYVRGMRKDASGRRWAYCL